MLSCGMPHFNALGWNLTFEVTTIWDRPKRNEDGKLRAVDETPNQCFKRLIRILWSIVLKAAERFTSRSAVKWPALSETKISFFYT